jgi:hypothetical protein
MTDPAGTGAGQQFSTRLVRNLLKNSEFRKAFVERFAFHMRETLAPSRVIAIIDELAAEIEPEISLNTTRWERPASLQAWKSEVEVLRNFARRRPAFIKQHLQQHLGLSAAEAALFP